MDEEAADGSTVVSTWAPRSDIASPSADIDTSADNEIDSRPPWMIDMVGGGYAPID